MAAITTRSTAGGGATVKGAPLTNTEVDTNFINLNVAKLEAGDALGTPASGTLTNTTGLPISTGVSGLGTGVATALGVNVGSAGAPVVNGGALGTPASGTLTNATGLPISTGVSGLGTNVATALGVNTGSAGAFVVNGGALGTPSSGTVTNLTGTASININGTVGATTPTTGAFTTATLSSDLTLSGGTANGVLYLNGSKVATSGSALTFASAGLDIASSGRVTNYGTGFVSGAGIELDYGVTANTGRIFTYDRGTSSWKTLQFGGDVITYNISGSEQMRLTSTGLGIGTSSPAYKLDVSGTGDIGARVRTTGVANAASVLIYNGNGTTSSLYSYIRFVNDDPNTQDWRVGTYGSNNLSIINAKAGTIPVVLDTSGNLGLGVTPSAWNSSWKALELSTGAAVSGRSDNSTIAYLQANSYRGASNWIYRTTGVSTLYAQDTGQHIWYTAPSGTAGNAITFTQSMTLDASGNLLVGTTSVNKLGSGATASAFQLANSGTGTADTSEIYVYNAATATDRYVGAINFGTSGASASEKRGAIIGCQLSATSSTNVSASLNFFTNNAGTLAERARITSGGDLLVGTTSNSTTSRCFIENAGSNVLTVSNSAAGGYNLITRAQSNGGTYYHASFEESTTQRGSITSNGSATAYNTSSDYRLKNIDGPLTGSGEFIDALKPKVGTWKTNGSKFVGFLAHEVQEVSPGSVVGTKDAVDADGNPIMQAMEYGSAEFIANIIAELQSLRQRVALLEGN